MKKLGALSLVLLIASAALAAQDAATAAAAADGLVITGDVKTGIIIEKETGKDPVTYVGHNDDAGTPGRIRLNFAWTKGNFVLKWRTQFNDEQQTKEDSLNPGKFTLRTTDDVFSYAFGSALFLNNQVRISAGKLDDAAWSIGGEVDEVWANADNGSGARFEVMPGILPGLNLGLTLPAAFGDGGAALSPADYFAEVAYGAKYVTDSVDLRVSFKGDAEKDYNGGMGATWTPEDGGGRLLYGADLKFLDSLVPGLKFAVIGKIDGIKTNDNVADSALNTTNWARVMYSPGPLEVYLKGNLETWADGGKTWKTNSVLNTGTTFAKNAFTAKAGGSYAVTPWFKPSLEAALVFYSYGDNFKVGTEDPAVLDEFYVEPAVEFDLGNGLTVKPVFNITVNPANSPDAGKNEVKVDTKVMVRLTYSF